MNIQEQNEPPSPNSRTLRLHGLRLVILAPVWLALWTGLWLASEAPALKAWLGPILTIVQLVLNFVVFLTLFVCPVYFTAGLIQLITGRRIGMVEAYWKEDASKSQATVSGGEVGNGEERKK